MNVTIYKRHNETCDHRGDRTYRRCNCRVWLGWWIEGKQFQVSAKTRSWEAAARQARAIEERAEDGLAPTATAAKTVAEAIDLFLANKRGEKIASDSLYRHEHILIGRPVKGRPAPSEHLLGFCKREGVIFIKDITLHHLTTWRGEWKVQAPQARSRQEKLRNFFKFCLGSGMIASNPAAQMSAIKVKNDSDAVRVFEPKEYEQVIAATSKTTMTSENAARIKVLMQLQRFSGLSLVDAVCLSKDELQQVGKEFRVSCDRQKTGTHVSNWIPAWLGKELLTVKNGNPKYFFWSGTGTSEDAPSYFQKLYRKVFDASGVGIVAEGRKRKFSSHCFRHTYAVELLKSGVDIRTVSKALGHKSLQVTERFYAKWNKSQQDKMDDTLRSALG
jgi:site-specific recombinase XerD